MHSLVTSLGRKGDNIMAKKRTPMHTTIDSILLQQLKIQAIKEGVALNDILEKAGSEYLNRQEKTTAAEK